MPIACYLNVVLTSQVLLRVFECNKISGFGFLAFGKVVRSFFLSVCGVETLAQIRYLVIASLSAARLQPSR